MKAQYKVITLPPFDKSAPESYMIEKKSKVFFNLFTIREKIGDYKWGEMEGHYDWMPFFNMASAEKRIEILKSNN